MGMSTSFALSDILKKEKLGKIRQSGDLSTVPL